MEDQTRGSAHARHDTRNGGRVAPPAAAPTGVLQQISAGIRPESAPPFHWNGNTSTGSPHDRLAYSTFSNPIHAAAWLQDCLGPDRAAHFDWPTLRLVAARLQGRGLRFGLADFVFEVRLLHRNRLVRIVVEHRSFLDLGLHDTLLRYAVHLAHVTRRNRTAAPMPPSIEPRLRAASLVELDRWADRILDAATLDAVFATG